MREAFPLKEYKPVKKHIKSTDRYRNRKSRSRQNKGDTTLMNESHTWSSQNLRILSEKDMDEMNQDLQEPPK